MMTSFYNLLKYAKTGIASPGMTAYDKMRALAAAGGGAIKTLTGVPPLTFKANGKPLISWSMLGNGQQSGTPAPDAPIMPTFCGERTGNLFNYQTMAGTLKGYYLDSNGNLLESAIAAVTDYIPCSGGKFSLAKVGGRAPSICLYDNNKHFLYGQDYNTASGSDKQTIVVDSSVNASYIRFTYFYAEAPKDNLSTIMLNAGSAPLPYEPYGYKIPITCAGQTTPIYTGDPLRKALDGSDAVDVLSSAGTITRAVDADGNALATPVTQAVDVPEIPTAKGANTLTVDTDLQPSSMTITYR